VDPAGAGQVAFGRQHRGQVPGLVGFEQGQRPRRSGARRSCQSGPRSAKRTPAQCLTPFSGSLAIWRALAATASAVNPNFSAMAWYGAEAP
jgi:hypothetical protein